MVIDGPSAQQRADRLALVAEFVQRLYAGYPGQIAAVAAYGSLARGDDRPYSDIELFCLLSAPDTDRTLEWVYGAGKAEINLYGLRVARERASKVDAEWAASQGQFVYARCIAGNPALIDELKRLVLSASDRDIAAAVEETTVGELYEWIGKLRNASRPGSAASVPGLACRFLQTEARIIGLLHRRVAAGETDLIEGPLRLEDLPQGYEGLWRIVRSGELSETGRVIERVEAAWRGIVAWEAAKGVVVSSRRWPA